MAPALQLIIYSNTKINARYRFQLAGTAYRRAKSGLLIIFVRTFLNALKSQKNEGYLKKSFFCHTEFIHKKGLLQVVYFYHISCILDL